MEIVKCDVAKARKCVYGMAQSAPVSSNLCNYLLITGKMRGCSSDKCDKFEKVTKKNPKKRSGSEFDLI